MWNLYFPPCKGTYLKTAKHMKGVSYHWNSYLYIKRQYNSSTSQPVILENVMYMIILNRKLLQYFWLSIWPQYILLFQNTFFLMFFFFNRKHKYTFFPLILTAKCECKANHMALLCLYWTIYMLVHASECVTVHICAPWVCVGVCNSFLAQLSWVMEFCTGGPCAPLWHQAAIVLLSWSIMSSGGWPCSGGRGPITRLITQAWLLLSSAVPGTPQPVAVWMVRGRRTSVYGEDGEDFFLFFAKIWTWVACQWITDNE